MLKVLIADDEERICRLIKALVDWEELGMEIVATASNGMEAVELVERLKPDLLITDIRMPGCDGLELIQQVKGSNPQIEIVIISGYAHFSYAQTAIKYGVGDYLLKPINKVELTQTLEKLYRKIMSRNKAEHDMRKLRENREDDRNRAKRNLISEMLEKKEFTVNEDDLRNVYHLSVKQGIYQCFCLKMDYDMKQLGAAARQVMLEKTVDIIQGNMKSVCYEIVLDMKEYVSYGILNYPSKAQSDVRRIMRDCLNQLTVQKSILGPVDFAIAMGRQCRDVAELPDALRKSTLMIQERILLGTGCLIEKIPDSTGLQDKNLLEKYSRMMLHAVEVLSTQEGEQAVSMLREEVTATRNIRGYEIYDLVVSAGNLFLMQIEHKKKNEVSEEFKRKCNQCGTIESLFACLSELQNQIICQISGERQNDALRPIRQAKQYIQSHYSEQITLEEVSDAVGLSSGYFSVLFKKETGEGFAKYLINLRIEQAKILLRESNSSVADICKQVGYNDLKHFTHIFDKATGLKPGAYRKLYG